MPDSTFRWHSLLRALGIKGDAIPAINFDWQPVLIIANASQLSPMLMAPQALFGGALNPGVGFSLGLEVKPISDGGCVVEHFAWGSGGTASNVVVDITPAQILTLNAPTAVTAIDMMSTPVKTAVTRGGTAFAFPSDRPRLNGRVNVESVLYTANWYVPAGEVLSIWTNQTSLSTNFYLRIRDIPEAAGAP